MSDTSWREAARALRTGQVSVETFVDALGDDRTLLSGLDVAIHARFRKISLSPCVCGHGRHRHDDYKGECFSSKATQELQANWVVCGCAEYVGKKL